MLSKAHGCFQKHSGAFKSTQVLSKALRCFQKHLGAFKSTWVLSNTLRCFQKHLGAVKHTQVLSKALGCFQMHRCFQTHSCTSFQLHLYEVQLSSYLGRRMNPRTIYRTPPLTDGWYHLIKFLFFYRHPLSLSETKNQSGS